MGKPRRPEKGETEGGASAVVGAWENHAQGEGKQEDDRLVRRRNDPWTWIIKSIRLGYSAFNANSISGARQIPTMHGGTCGVGSPTLACFATLGGAWPPTEANGSAGIDGMTVARIRAKVGEQRFLDGLQAAQEIVPPRPRIP